MDHARDELMSHIHRCGVLKASQEQQDQWLEDTMQFMAERYTGLAAAELDELREIGRRFCQPVIPHGKGNTAISADSEMTTDSETAAESDMTADSDSGADSEQGEMAGAV